MQRKQATPLVSIENELTLNAGVKLFIKRDDLIDAEISGNKYRKLSYNMLAAKGAGFDKILTFGGAFSNHIAATAVAARKFNIPAVGIIRGDELNKNSNPTLRKAADDGMELLFVSRVQYKERENPQWIDQLQSRHHAYVIPEGGSNQLALKGVKEMADEINLDFNYIFCPVGTGGTLAGIVSALNPQQTAIGIAALQGETYLTDMVKKLINDQENWRVNSEYHFGGYAKINDQLIAFINQFYRDFHIPLDPVYTGKMMFGIFDLIKKGVFERHSKIVAVHTGGLQGIKGFNEKNEHNQITFEDP